MLLFFTEGHRSDYATFPSLPQVIFLLTQSFMLSLHFILTAGKTHHRAYEKRRTTEICAFIEVKATNVFSARICLLAASTATRAGNKGNKCTS